MTKAQATPDVTEVEYKRYGFRLEHPGEALRCDGCRAISKAKTDVKPVMALYLTDAGIVGMYCEACNNAMEGEG